MFEWWRIGSHNMNYVAIHCQQCGTVVENGQPNIAVSAALLVGLGGELCGFKRAPWIQSLIAMSVRSLFQM